MKKRLLSALLALCMALALLPAASADDSVSAGYSSSGSTALTKLTKQEIARLLNDNSLTMPDSVFETEPSYTAPYAPGEVKQEALQIALNRLNALRRIAGLPSVELDSAWCDAAQYGAVLLSVSSAFGYYPPQPADMDDSFYSIATSATSTSNIAGGFPLAEAVDGFMDDSDAANVRLLGHRRWQLNPNAAKVGFGYAAHGAYNYYVDEKVFESYSSNSGICEYDFVAWPASGSFPNTLFGPSIAWSVTVDPEQYQTPSLSAVSVTLTRQSDGKAWAFSGIESYTADNSGMYFNVDTGSYGVGNCIIFRPDGVSRYEGVYTVTVTGLKTSDGADAALSYQVDFFDPDDVDAAPDEPAAPELPTRFKDVPAGEYYTDAVVWAVDNGIATGVGGKMFSPGTTCTEVQILTFLWRAENEPAAGPSSLTVDPAYQAAVDWAFEKGMINTQFDPNAPCSRARAVYYIWMARGKEIVTARSFKDVDAGAYYADAVSWAVANDITNGIGGKMFSPDTTCMRAVIVTFLYRAYTG